MNILVIGSGGREHALAWKLAQSPNAQVFVAPGNPGCEQVATCIDAGGATPDHYLAVAERVGAQLTVVGPEAPLVAGVVDAFRAKGHRIVGPTAEAARLEGSKLFAKQVMEDAGIATARSVAASSKANAAAHVRDIGFPLVVKYDGLAAGKGVVICANEADALIAIAALPEGAFVLEEFLEGEEVSFIAYVHENGSIIPFEATQDHKTIFDGDTGPNTGGMGAYCDGRIITPSESSALIHSVIQPAVNEMRMRGTPYSGFLYAGLMMSGSGANKTAKVLEFNARLGDPETQCLMHRMASDLVPTLVDAAPMKSKPEPSVCVVAAAAHYPDTPRTGDVVHGLDCVGGASVVFQAGTRREGSDIVTTGGRVLGITASGATLAGAIANTYDAVQHVSFDGMQYRTDIGAKGLKRW